ncbi:MAG: NAD(P)H:quinone oxidoreductase [Woeseiaceae bacterium]|nr:NAD(P)H:quinone oxidoreductase [Woeseiaceae bacterium]
MTDILVVYFSRNGSTEALAREVASGVDTVPGAAARLRTLPPVSSVAEATEEPVPDSGPPYASNADLKECAGLLLGSPTHFGNMAAAVKYFLDGTTAEWFGGSLSGKPAGLFTSTSSLHGGQETTLLSMAIPLLHHGMLITGLPYSNPELSETTTGGTPYGASHVSWNREDDVLSGDEKTLARALGKRVAGIALRMAG